MVWHARRFAFSLAVTVLLAVPAWSDELSAEPPSPDLGPSFFHNVRARYEWLDDGNFPNTDDALTVRLRSGMEFSVLPKTRLLVEGEGILSVFGADQPANRIAGQQPLLADFENAELNRFQLSTSIIPRVQLTAGRQRIALDDMRFVGNFEFRQSDLTYDSVRAQGRWIGPLQFDVAYLWRVNRRFGERSRSGGLRSDTILLNVNLPTPVGHLAGFHYDIDTSLAPNAAAGDRFKARTSGLRLVGRYEADQYGLDWQASWARQNRKISTGGTADLSYLMAGISGTLADVDAAFSLEVLEGNGLVAFQTPFALLHKFQGFADVFLVTPRDGIRDYNATLTWRIASWEDVRGLTAFTRVHRFTADRGGAHYGNEIDMGIRANVLGLAVSLEYAFYDANSFGSDVQRLWFTIGKSF